METLSILLTATALSAAAGFRAFLPLFGLALVQRTGTAIPMADGFEWLSSDQALIILGIAAFIEFAGDKVPLVDNLLDAIGLFVRPVAGTTAAVASTSEMGAGAAIATGIIAFLLSGAVAGTKAAERGASTGATGGLANPVLSVKDDIVAGGTVVAGLALPLIVPFVLYAIYSFYRAAARRFASVIGRFRGGRATSADSPTTPPGPPSSA